MADPSVADAAARGTDSGTSTRAGHSGPRTGKAGTATPTGKAGTPTPTAKAGTAVPTGKAGTPTPTGKASAPTTGKAGRGARNSGDGPPPGNSRGGPRAGHDPGRLVERARDRDPRALARLISLVENGTPELRPVMKALAPLCRGHGESGASARVIGLTGSPGVGKSTLTGALVRHYRGQDLRVGVIAVDPSSPFTGGALLGDRIRMQDHATDDGVFIRSMASRGHLGGLAVATPQALRVLDAAGFDLIMVETVGVGQAEVEVASLADSTLVLVAPGMGDSVQAAKAGILEVADVFAVNKADRPQVQQTVRDLRNMIALGHSGNGQKGEGEAGGSWKPPIVSTVASTGEGIAELAGRLDAHWAWLGESGQRERRRLARAREEVAGIAVAALRKQMRRLPEGKDLDDLASRVVGGELDSFTAADQLVETLVNS